MGAFEGIALVIAGAVVKWFFDMSADRTRKSDDADKDLQVEEYKLREKVASLDKTNSTAIATLTAGIEHIVEGLAGIRSDMKEHREVVFKRLDRNDGEIKEIKDMVSKTGIQLHAIEIKLKQDGSK